MAYTQQRNGVNIADGDGYHYAPPTNGTGLGVFGIDDAVVAWGGSRVVDWIGGEGGSEKAQRALTEGAAVPGPYSEGQLLTAIRTAGTGSPGVVELRRRVTVKDWLQGIGIEQDDRRLARVAVFLAHGGKDGRLGATEQSVSDQVGVLMRQAGAAVYPDPTYTSPVQPFDTLREQFSRTVDALQQRYLVPEPVELGMTYEGARPAMNWIPWALGGAALFLIRR